jgi:hypothetical protein
MMYAYGATIVEIVRRKEFCESLISIITALAPNRAHSPILLPESSKHSRGYG